jgi:hypothetical protein
VEVRDDTAASDPSRSLLVAEILERPVDIAAWQRMRMPDWCVLDVGVAVGRLSGSLIADWGAWVLS